MSTDINCGYLRGIWIKRAKRGPMDPAQSADLEMARGIRGNADQKGKRQVTVIELEVWKALMRYLEGSLSPSARRANLMLEGIRLANSRGHILQIGTCQIMVSGETRPCEQMKAELAGLRAAMRPDWRGGAFGEVICDGRTVIGDAVRWLD